MNGASHRQSPPASPVVLPNCDPYGQVNAQDATLYFKDFALGTFMHYLTSSTIGIREISI